MAPGIHPPCTPPSSCQPARCHPTPPPCEYPEECLRNTTLLGVQPCKSAASIMATRSRTRCSACGKFGHQRPRANNVNDPRRVQYIHNYLRRKDHEEALQRHDQIAGTRLFTDYLRSRGRVRDFEDCCAGHGHRGRMLRRRFGGQRTMRNKERERLRRQSKRGILNRVQRDPYGNPKARKCMFNDPLDPYGLPVNRRCCTIL